MSEITIKQVTQAIRATLSSAYSLVRTYSGRDMPEGIQDTPSIAVYAVDGETDKRSDNAERTTYRGGVRVAGMTINVDVYVRQRSHMGDDMALTDDVADEIYRILEAQTEKPYFELEGIKGFRWRWQRVIFSYGDPEIKFVGVQFVLSLTIF